MADTTQPAAFESTGTYSRFTDFDVHLFRAGKHQRLYEKFGSHVVEHNGVTGTYFAVWHPLPDMLPLSAISTAGTKEATR